MRRRWQLWAVVMLVVSLITTACGINSASPTPTPGPLETVAKTDTSLLDLIAKYQTSDLETTRAYARQLGLLDSQDNVKFSLTLDKASSVPAVSDRLKTLGAMINASYDNKLVARIELAKLVQQIGQRNFWEEIAQLQAVQTIQLVPPVPTSVVSAQNEGLKVIGGDEWQRLGYTGKGIKIGLIDGGFAGYKRFLGTALPPPAQVNLKSFLLGEGEGSDNHGTAVAEVVGSLAPQAELLLTPIEDEVGFALAVDYLVAQHVKIISIALAWGGLWPSDGSSLMSRKLDEAEAKGVLVVVSAGNYGQAHVMAKMQLDPNGFHRFNASVNTVKVTVSGNGGWIALRWDEDWAAPKTNLDLYLQDGAGKAFASSRNLQGANSPKPPLELATFRAAPGAVLYAQVRLNGAATDAPKFHLFGYGVTIEGSDPAESIATPADAKSVLAVGATNWRDDKLEGYSSRGPTADGRSKPDILAPTNISSAIYLTGFGGTSAAAPQVAGSAAIVWSAAPGFSNAQVAKYLTRNAQTVGNQPRLKLGPVAATRGGPAELLGAVANGPVWQDDFSRSSGASFEQLPFNALGYYGQQTGGQPGYFVRVLENGQLNWNVYKNRQVEEFAAEVTITPGVGPENYFYGLIFWQRESDDYFLYCVSGQRYAVLRRTPTGWSEVIRWGRDEALNRTTVRLKLEATTGYLKIKGGDTVLQSVALPANAADYSRGKLGFAVGRFGQNSPTDNVNPEIVFTDLKVTPLSSR